MHPELAPVVRTKCPADGGKIIKRLKRDGYGRSNFDLLIARTLLTA
jgi:hypothetical protein